jgi:poly-gamma-glutamate synthesis protein (capsule biosynthesis protein)
VAGVAIGLLGDVMLGRSVGEALTLGERAPEELWDPALRRLATSLELVIANVECCLSARGERTARIPRKPFFFRGPPEAARALTAVGVRAAGVANNHALDYEEPALRDTLTTLRAAGIVVGGAGAGLDEARAPAVVQAGALRIALLAVTDHPAPYAAAPGAWGVAHADLREGTPAWLSDAVRDARRSCDLVVVFPHWGPNMATRPAPWQVRAARELQRAGADLVAGHSAHVFHGVGWEDEGPVLFDLGDVLDDYRVDPVLRNDLGVLAVWRPGSDRELELVGLRLRYCFTGLAEGADADWIADRLTRACRPLGTRVERTAEQRFLVTRR